MESENPLSEGGYNPDGATPPLIAGVLEAIGDAAILLDRNGRVSFANAAAQDRFGVWIVGQSYVSVLRQPDMLAPVEDAFFQRRRGTARFAQSSGAIDSLYDVTITPLLADEAERPLVLLTFRDVSEAQAGESMRRDFVANVSHELKTPLTAMTGFIETLQGPARHDPTAQERFLGMMAQEAARMNRLVADLLSLSRVEAQSRRRPRDRIDVMQVLGEALETLRERAGAAKVTLSLDGPTAAPILGDRDQIMQVATNLVENGIKYGAHPGEVRVRVVAIDREPVIKGPAWRVEVADRGSGIPAEHLPRLTERFYRVDTGRSRAQGGTGLGLAIVKHIVNRHRGRLKIESREGQGTTITVILPAMTGGSTGRTVI
ncbi:MAG: ATP-binding protein [Pseudomonadota bacterium]